MLSNQYANPFGRRLTHAVRIIFFVTGAVFLVQLIADESTRDMLVHTFGLHLRGLRRLYVWQPVSYMFLHGGVLHILMNMLLLYFFGCEMENVLGTRSFVKLYLGSGILGGLGWLVIDLPAKGYGYCIGASGAVYGIMGAFAAIFPARKITLLLFFVLPVTMTARTMAIALAVLSLALMMKADSNVAHAAHLAGGIAGYLYGLRVLRSPMQSRPIAGQPGVGFISAIRAKILRRQMRVVDEPEEPPSPEEVDRILEKIKEEGIDRLSRKERRILDEASRMDR